MKTTNDYVGRFAPTPSGALHFGSLIAALASYLDARSVNGRWLIRIEDVDRGRSRQIYQDKQLFSLQRHGFEHDGEIRIQSQHLEDYQHKLLHIREYLYPCDCSRKKWKNAAKMGKFGKIYPEFCRQKTISNFTGTAIRLRLPREKISFDDRLLGRQTYDLKTDIGDPILKRSNGDFAYSLAVVVDDALQGITDVVRGQDLTFTTAIHLYLQRILGVNSPRYLHFPLVKNPDGSKLSKQNHATALNDQTPSQNLIAALQFLGQKTDDLSENMPPREILSLATSRWIVEKIPKISVIMGK